MGFKIQGTEAALRMAVQALNDPNTGKWMRGNNIFA